jgi:hypothetical protein
MLLHYRRPLGVRTVANHRNSKPARTVLARSSFWYDASSDPTRVAFVAAISKLAANVATYPIETTRMMVLGAEARDADGQAALESVLANPIRRFYRGIDVSLMYGAFNYVASYQILFSALAISVRIVPERSLALALASAAACVVTTLYKAPLVMVLRNRMLAKSLKLRDLAGEAFRRGYTVLLIEDTVEYFIKIQAMAFCSTHLPWIEPRYRTLAIAIGTTVCLLPTEQLKNNIMCGIPRMSVFSVGFRVVSATLNTWLFLAIFEALRALCL